MKRNLGIKLLGKAIAAALGAPSDAAPLATTTR